MIFLDKVSKNNLILYTLPFNILCLKPTQNSEFFKLCLINDIGQQLGSDSQIFIVSGD